jgi:hypothetical protein
VSVTTSRLATTCDEIGGGGLGKSAGATGRRRRTRAWRRRGGPAVRAPAQRGRCLR